MVSDHVATLAVMVICSLTHHVSVPDNPPSCALFTQFSNGLFDLRDDFLPSLLFFLDRPPSHDDGIGLTVSMHSALASVGVGTDH